MMPVEMLNAPVGCDHCCRQTEAEFDKPVQRARATERLVDVQMQNVIGLAKQYEQEDTIHVGVQQADIQDVWREQQ